MSAPAARQGDPVTGTDIHIVLVPTPGGPSPTPLPHAFSGTITGGCAFDVLVDGLPVAVIGSTVTNQPPHLPTPPGTAFQRPPANRGTVQRGSTTVVVGGKGIARSGDTVLTCADPVDTPNSTIVSGSTTVVVG